MTGPAAPQKPTLPTTCSLNSCSHAARERSRRWLGPGALVVLHDYGNPAYPGVAEAVQELGLSGREHAGMWVWEAPA